jgi:catechol 2,3-dioxygenase-like lactoylglutathione lyase family enzyme
MSVKLAQIVIDCHDPERLAKFWGEVLGWQVIGHEDDGSVEIGDPAHSPLAILFEPVPEAKTMKNRLHLDVRPVGASQAEELERLRALGATDADVGQGDQTWVVLADPEGNEFCLLRNAPEPPTVSPI